MQRSLIQVFALAAGVAVLAASTFAEDVDLTAVIREAYEADHSLVAYSDSGHFGGEGITGYTPFDGITTQRWLSEINVTTAWVQLAVADGFVADKGGMPVVKSFTILSANNGARRPEFFVVQVSDDGENWVEAYRARTPRLTWTSDNKYSWEIEEPLVGKYVRFFFIKPTAQSNYTYNTEEIYLYGVLGNSVISECDGLTEQGKVTERFKPRYFEGESAVLNAPEDFSYGGVFHVCIGYRLEISEDGGQSWESSTYSDRSVTLPVGSTLYRVTWLWQNSSYAGEVDLTAEVRKAYEINRLDVTYSTSSQFQETGVKSDAYTPFDGITSQRWLSGANVSTAWFQIDLADTFADGKMPQLTKVRLFNNHSGRRPIAMEMKVSEDGESWTSVATVTEPLTWDGNYAEFGIPNKTVGRHFRLEMTTSTGGTAQYLYDIEELWFYGKYRTASGLTIVYR